MLEFNLLIECWFIFSCLGGISCYRGISQCGQVHLTVSSLRDTFLEMNWITDCSDCDTIPEYLILSSRNVQDRDDDHGVLLTIKYSDYPSGVYTTKVKFGQPSLPGGWEYDELSIQADAGPHCFPYWISSVNGNVTIDSKCLAIQPTWMCDNSKTIGDLKISSMLLPGTHNSGSFSGLPAILGNYVLNQDRNVWTQLVFGIRYLDFRIGYYSNDGFFINHDVIRVTKVKPLLQEIKKFLQLAPKEIVILDFHRFPYPTNFTYEFHKKFVDMVYEELGTFALPRDVEVGQGPTISEIWKRNKTLIMSYADKNTVNENPWLWHPLRQYWGDTIKVSELKRFLQDKINNHNAQGSVNPLWALMSELTPRTVDVIFRNNNLRKLAKNVNGNVTTWFRDQWGKQANIVATDYFLGNDMINVAISMNSS